MFCFFYKSTPLFSFSCIFSLLLIARHAFFILFCAYGTVFSSHFKNHSLFMFSCFVVWFHLGTCCLFLYFFFYLNLPFFLSLIMFSFVFPNTLELDSKKITSHSSLHRNLKKNKAKTSAFFFSFNLQSNTSSAKQTYTNIYSRCFALI